MIHPEATDSTIVPPRWAAGGGLVYALAVFIVPLVQRADWRLWMVTAVSVAAFSGLYWLYLARCRTSTRQSLLILASMGALGFALMPLNVAAVTYVVYAAALAPLVLSIKQSVVLLVALAAGVNLELQWLDTADRLVIGGWTAFLICATGGSSLFARERERQHTRLRRAYEEIEGLATIAERERIARDLHDVLGHTLSVIALKSELASKLAASDPARAVAEIQDVETVAREALRDVRAAVEGYRGQGWRGELERARVALTASGVALALDCEPLILGPKYESVLALVLREAVTNVIRHARAAHCTIALHAVDGIVELVITDDGVGELQSSGTGLSGMRERILAIGGTLGVDSARGVTICARGPWLVAGAA